MSNQTVQVEEIPERIHTALIDEFGESQRHCKRGYVPSQSLKKIMQFLNAEQIQILQAKRLVKDKSESFAAPSFDLPQYVDTEEQLKRRFRINYNRAESGRFDWPAIQDFIIDAELQDVPISKLVFTMKNTELRDQLFDVLQSGINYPASYKSELADKFYFVMESKQPRGPDYNRIKEAHGRDKLEELGWKPRTLDLMAIWSHYAWVKSGNTPFRNGITQRDVEEFAFNQRETNKPVFGAVNSKLVINKWRQPFGRGLTAMKPYEFDEQGEWVRPDVTE